MHPPLIEAPQFQLTEYVGVATPAVESKCDGGGERGGGGEGAKKRQ